MPADSTWQVVASVEANGTVTHSDWLKEQMKEVAA